MSEDRTRFDQEFREGLCGSSGTGNAGLLRLPMPIASPSRFSFTFAKAECPLPE
jgi:hypothetical protein